MKTSQLHVSHKTFDKETEEDIEEENSVLLKESNTHEEKEVEENEEEIPSQQNNSFDGLIKQSKYNLKLKSKIIALEEQIAEEKMNFNLTLASYVTKIENLLQENQDFRHFINDLIDILKLSDDSSYGTILDSIKSLVSKQDESFTYSELNKSNQATFGQMEQNFQDQIFEKDQKIAILNQEIIKLKQNTDSTFVKHQTEELKEIKEGILNQNQIMENYFKQLNSNISNQHLDDCIFQIQKSNEQLIQVIDKLKNQENQNENVKPTKNNCRTPPVPQKFEENLDFSSSQQFKNMYKNDNSLIIENNDHSCPKINGSTKSKKKSDYSMKNKDMCSSNSSQRNGEKNYRNQNSNQQWISDTRKMYALEREIQIQNQKFGIISHNCVSLNSSPDIPSLYSTTLL